MSRFKQLLCLIVDITMSNLHFPDPWRRKFYEHTKET